MIRATILHKSVASNAASKTVAGGDALPNMFFFWVMVKPVKAVDIQKYTRPKKVMEFHFCCSIMSENTNITARDIYFAVVRAYTSVKLIGRRSKQ